MSVSVTPRVTSAPATVQALIRVAPDPGNRRLRVAIDSDTFYRNSDVALDGDSAPATHAVRWQSLPSGTYVVILS